MSPKLLKQYLEVVESKSVKISLLDGRQFTVPHTDYLMVANDGVQVVLLENGNALKIVDSERITSIDFSLPRRGNRRRT